MREYASPRLDAVADLLGVSPDLLRDAIVETAGEDVAPGRQVFINVRRPRYGHVRFLPTSRIWRVAREINVEPEELRDAMLEVLDPPPGRVASLGVRARPRRTA